MERLPLRDNPVGRTLLLTSLAMLAMGVVMVQSAVASVAEPGKWYARVDMRHTLFAVAAAIVLLVCWRFDYRVLAKGGRLPILPAVILLLSLLCACLVFVPGVGRSVGGHNRWIRLGPSQYGIGFQPSELIKLALPVFLAAWLSRKNAQEVRSFIKTFLPAVALIGVCTGMVAPQNFATAALIGISAAAVLVLAGVPLAYLLTLILPAAAGVWALVVRVPHRWARIVAFMDPFSTTNPSAYQPRQSLQAILAGGWFGQGPGRGMHKLGFLPEDSTDFIFSVFCEEWGFVGAVLLIGLIVLWIYAARKAALNAGRLSDGSGSTGNFGRLLVGSLGFIIGLQAMMHIAVDLVVAPPTGISLPFISAGGTALVLTAVGVALIVSVTSRPAAAQT